jgi:co-chaperonin GroES (HSP10)
MNKAGINPLGYNVLLKMPEKKEKTNAGIILPNASTQMLFQRVGQIVDMGCKAFTDAFNEVDENKPSINDYVMINDHAGKDIKINEDLYRVVSSDEIRCKISKEIYDYFIDKL